MSLNIEKYIDHTNLKPDSTTEKIISLCHEANKFGFFSICIHPSFLELAKKYLKESVALCTVVGFPLGLNTIKIKVEETKNMIELGANEIDMVINISALKDGNHQLIEDEIASVVEASKGNIVKVIIETCLLNEREKIDACHLIEKAGAHFIKTSTGFSHSGAQLEDIKLFKDNLKKDTKIKASGGIKTREQALAFIEAGANRIGTSSGIEILNY